MILTESVALYVHIPFCLKKCFYCDFVSKENSSEQVVKDYVQALFREMHFAKNKFSDMEFSTIFFGGGTPTVLSEKALCSILEKIFTIFKIAKQAEVTVEANPETLNYQKLKVLKENGFNRLSIGVQSLSDLVLQKNGRVHNALCAEKAIDDAKKAGFNNINVDLMYGLLGQQVVDIEKTLKSILEKNLQHISYYGLKVEEGTKLKKMLLSKEVVLIDEKEEEKMYDYALEMLEANGFERYEISNFAKKGFECRHNMHYWQYKNYLGMGVSACSFFENERSINTLNLEEYLQNTEKKNCKKEILKENEKISEYLFLHLRTQKGVLYQDFQNFFGESLEVLWSKWNQKRLKNIFEKLVQTGLLSCYKEGFCLTKQGMKFGNVVFREFICD